MDKKSEEYLRQYIKLTDTIKQNNHLREEYDRLITKVDSIAM